MSKDAGLAVGKYMETFVREAIARAAYERTQSANGTGDDFLEVCFFTDDFVGMGADFISGGGFGEVSATVIA